MRIVAGSARGRPLEAPRGTETRPTSDRVRQSLFDLLGQRCDGLRVLDLYAGTGALALEALSRGAARATLVESARAACQCIVENAATLGFAEQVILLSRDVKQALPGLAGEQFELIFADPPYALQNSGWLVERIAGLKLLAPGGRAVLERSKREARPAIPQALAVLDERTYGDTAVLVLEAPPDPVTQADE